VVFDILKVVSLEQLNEYFSSIVLELCKAIKEKKPSSVVDTIICYINKNYSKRLSLSLVAKVFGYNSVYLGRLFKRQTNQSFNDCVEQIRIERAKDLIDRGVKITSVARQVGFSDTNYFYLRFKEKVGCAPLDFRKNRSENVVKD
jgi:two-component system response regulator YesN